ncbi:MAG: outer membrane beta-barrel protein [Candidatus Krumholzibacteriia bacterium]
MFKRSLALFALAALVLGATGASALDFQQKSWYAQGLLSMPIGDWSDFVNLGFGGGFGMTVPHTDVLSFRGEISYLTYGTDSGFYGDDYDVSASGVPVLVLAEYDLADNPFYLVGGLGLAFMSVKVDYNGPFGSASASDGSTEFGLVAGGGYVVNENISIEGRLNLISDSNHLSVGGVYHF